MKRFLHIFPVYVMIISLCASFEAYASGENDDEFNAKFYPTILQVRDSDEVADLEAAGIVIWHQRDYMVLALIPLDNDGESPLMSKVRKKHSPIRRLPRRAVPSMDIAKTHFDASDIHTGKTLGTPYTGKGVVVGLCDIGMDPNHINFLDKNGRSRVKRVVYLNELQNERLTLETADAIRHWRSDDETMTHGTHVAGIMAGSYSENGYSGMAPDAEIVMASCQLYDAGILAACEEIIDYAKSVGKPAVINLSLSSYNGPHDGTTLFNRYLDLLGQEAIICIAAGNNGQAKCSMKLDFSADNPDWMCRIFNSAWDQMKMNGLTDVWSRDDTPLKFRFHIYDDIETTLVYSSPMIDNDTELPYIVSDKNDAEFAKYLTGYLSVDTGINELNGRWFLNFDYSTQAREYHSPEQLWARYSLVIEVVGDPGQHADVTADGQFSWFNNWKNYKGADDSLSVGDIATGENLICVGMYNNRSEMPRLDGTVKDFGVKPLTISNYSSFGTLIDGRVLPHTVAPGAFVVSSISTDYTEKNPDLTSKMTAKVSANGKEYYWYYELGTSMSTPYVAGSIATWLEAMPDLTISEIKKIIGETNATDCYDAGDPHNGQGWFRPVDGLQKALKYSSVTSGAVDRMQPSVFIRGEVAEIYNPANSILTASLVSLDGSAVINGMIIESGFSTMDLSALHKGVYIITLNDGLNSPVVTKFIR